MSVDTDAVRMGLEWLVAELERIRYGKVGISVVIHNGVVARVLRSIEDQPLEVATPQKKGDAA